MKEWLEGEDLSDELKKENPFLRQEVRTDTHIQILFLVSFQKAVHTMQIRHV